MIQQRHQENLTQLAGDATLQAELSGIAARRHAERANKTLHDTAGRVSRQGQTLTRKMAAAGSPAALMAAWSGYLVDAGQRALLTGDAMRRRADIFVEHQAAGSPPVLIYDYEVIVEGRDLTPPSNYMLLRILPPEGIEVLNWKRPYVIIDPRAGHGAGIGGFKNDSQVGVALKDGHPVYFVAFHPDPEPGQTLADVTHSEAEFLREVIRRHPDSPKPIVVGNCQGGWGTAILAATHPDLVGPIVLNGAPMSYWGGKLGQDPMRYSGGIVGGAVSALVAADLGAGQFDGANLVQNFEGLNPGRTWFRKYYDLYQNVDEAVDRFLEFERWWGGYYMMTEAEIRWIVENLFIGNKLGKNEAYLQPGRLIDLKAIRTPVIVFASHGDNITPPAQALNWIVDTYTDEVEIGIRGQRILYMVHEQVGHLGIFVSSSVARREHSQMASTMKTIEALSPGLYEMLIEDHEGEGSEKTFTVSFARRKMTDILKVTGPRRDEAAFAGVARASEAIVDSYDATLRPLIQASVQPQMAEFRRHTHPMRMSRAAFSSATPGMAALERAAELARENRRPADPENPFLLAERLWADMMEKSLDGLRDIREALTELVFLSVWASPLALRYGAPHAHTRTHKAPQDLRALPEVQTALSRIETGGLAEGIVRMLVLLADTRGDVRRDRLERSSELLSTHAPFNDIAVSVRAGIIHEQSLIVTFARDAAFDTLPRLLRTDAERQQALEAVAYVLGSETEMEPATLAMLARMRNILEHPKQVAE